MNKLVVIGVLVLVVVGGGYWWMANNKGGSVNKTETTEVKTNNNEGSVTNTMPVNGSGAEEMVVAGEAKEFTVVGKNFRFNPAEIRVKKGETVRVLFKSEDMKHDFMIDEFEVATAQLGAGEEEEVEFVADKVGTFEYYCSVGQHRANGMVGKLIVE
jgi:plastocyanin